MEWFPKPPSHQAFDRLLTELTQAFSAILQQLMEEKPAEAIDMSMPFVDSTPILLKKHLVQGT